MIKKIWFPIIILIVATLFITIFYHCAAGSSEIENLLWDAISKKNLELVKDAVAQGANINEFSQYSHYVMSSGTAKIVRSPVWIAIERRENKIAEYLLDCGADINSYEDRNGRTLVQYCATERKSMLRKVVESGADLFHADKMGRTAIDYAANVDAGDYAFKLFIESGAIPTTKTGEIALKNNQNKSRFGMLKVIMQYTDELEINSALRYAILGNGEAAVKYASSIDDKTDLIFAMASFCEPKYFEAVYNRSISYSELLQYAVLYGNSEIIIYLMENGEMKNISGLKLGLYAARNNEVELFEFLDKNGIYYSKKEAIEELLYSCNQDCIEYLLSDGFYSDILLEEACFAGNTKVVEMLLHNDDTFEGKEYACPMVYASREGYTDIVALLIEAGANPNIEYDKETPLYAAVRYGYFDIVELLIENGADLEWKNSNGESLLDILQNYNLEASAFESLHSISHLGTDA